ncbi:NAD(P)H-hydrate dehydratase [Geothermobacter hydrogeniphilus]|uniref:Bifunctional NAD(P)H-hydrate repair enzyme n=1 Tax=Geothermobacter hydrogeniphilus TaxID=1969733 RepID=A0A1X0YD88_9BACT|nr:NAD(P)H-hydrate dehydratase [Geothermobacter hydrogeniphilus]ORJ63043.1 hypothetical protein B5V00_03060 [Geothermobacter hydrogeniphilus]
MRVLTAEQMRELDRRTIEEIGVPGVVLMENAGRAVADVLCREYADLSPGPVLILCGRGNNGGDGFVVARLLLDRGWQVETLLLAEADQVVGDAAVNLRALRNRHGKITVVADEESLRTELARCQPKLVVDALFGTGLNADLRGHAVMAVAWINAFAGPVVAVDIPSGVAAGSGRQLGCAVRADVTVTFAAPKLGHLLHPGAELRGELRIADIGIPQRLAEDLDESCFWLTAEVARSLLPDRPCCGHKGTFGHLLLIAGSRGKSGAAVLAAKAGLRSGAGLVTVAVPGSQQAIVAAAVPEVMTEAMAEDQGKIASAAADALSRLTVGKQALAIGPGLGQSSSIQTLVTRLLDDWKGPMVLDADALNVLADATETLRRRDAEPLVVTPHPGEMARLLGTTVAEVEADRPSAARDFARLRDVVVVLKGAPTLIASPAGELAVNSSGNPLLATAGSGDVLTGLIGGLLAQGLDSFAAARLGVYLHGAAADRLRCRIGDAGMLAGELAAEIPPTRQALKGGLLC